jgi:predicted TIM-barrel fold metal-dependent hydrolase
MYNGVKVLDIHAHVFAPGHGMQILAWMLAGNSPLSDDPRRDLPHFGMTEESWAKTNGEHLALIKDRSIDYQLLGPRPFLMAGWMQRHLLAPWSRFVNNMIARQVSMSPDTFVGAAQLPQDAHAEDLRGCLPELDRCVNELGFKAVYLSPDPTGDRKSPGMDTRYWDPVYERCERLGIPIIVHGTNCTDPRLAPIPTNYQIGFVMEQYLATQLLSHGDVFHRFPELKIVVCHCGGALDRFIKTDPHLSQKDLSKNLFFDTNALDLNFLEAAIKQRTPQRMCYGTEVPGSGTAIRPETGRPGDDLVPIIGGFDFLTEDEKLCIFNRNPAAVCPGLGALDQQPQSNTPVGRIMSSVGA